MSERELLEKAYTYAHGCKEDVLAMVGQSDERINELLLFGMICGIETILKDGLDSLDSNPLH